MGPLESRLSRLEVQRGRHGDALTMSTAELEAVLVARYGHVPSLEELAWIAEEGDEVPDAAA